MNSANTADKSTRLALGSAAAVLFGGFGVMELLWISLPRDVSLPGLYHFTSATLGDALFLPVFIGGLAWLALTRRPFSVKGRLVATTTAAVGAGIGATTQLLWLNDPSPALNWTLAQHGHFNFAGWYHAVLLCVVCSLTGALVPLAVHHPAAKPVPDDRDSDRARKIIGRVTLVAGYLFVCLVVIDNLRQQASRGGGITLVALCFPTLVITALSRNVWRR